MKKLAFLLIIALAFVAFSCEKEETPVIIDEEVENYLGETTWQSYIPIAGSELMVEHFLIFKQNGICDYVDSTTNTVTVEKYYYDPVNGEPFNGVYYTNLYTNEAKTDIYENLVVQESLDKLQYYWVLGDMAAVITYKKIQ